VRPDALTCSGGCRTAYWRWLNTITPPWPTPPSGGFQLAAIDLPLSFATYSPKGEGRSPQSKYATLEPRTCIRLLRPMLAPWPKGLMARHARTEWWVYGPRRQAGREARFRVALEQIIRGCGFGYSTESLCWIKVAEIGTGEMTGWIRPGGLPSTGKTTRKGVENMLGAKRGKGIPIRDHGVDQRVFAVVGEHSEKPDGAYRALERLYGDVPRLEIFATKERPGWTGWGHIKGSEFVERLKARGLL